MKQNLYVTIVKKYFKYRKSLKSHLETIYAPVEFKMGEQCKSDEVLLIRKKYQELKIDLTKEITTASARDNFKRSYKEISETLENVIKRSLFFQPGVYNDDEFAVSEMQLSNVN